MRRWGVGSSHMCRRGDTPVSVGNPARERQYGVRRGAVWRPEKRSYCACNCLTDSLFLLYTNCLGGDIPWGLQGANHQVARNQLFKRGSFYYLRSLSTGRSIPCIVLRGGASEWRGRRLQQVEEYLSCLAKPAIASTVYSSASTV